MASYKYESGQCQKLAYVIQKHTASHLHYDLRLESDGILKSWAVPKEPPAAAGQKRLAIQVEDHPLGYEKFEGLIPEGQYGAGRVEIWDQGYYQLQNKTDNKLEILLSGEKLKGLYSLIRLKGKNREEKNMWLFFKNQDQKKQPKIRNKTGELSC
ncbi:MAG: DNA polymerase ligase N-terminal domain-containing protein [Acidobacteriota bacterium]|nr:DNA polymerase ligase N-terminal domain-containing protein [Acidobacteriota bacterium]